MGRKLDGAQQRKIVELVRANQATPAEETIGDSIQRALGLSEEEYRELSDEIGDYVEALFEGLATRE